MSKDIAFYIGETWTIDGVANKADGTPLDITGGAVEFRIASASALVFRAQSSDVAIAPGTAGSYTINVPANDARQSALMAGVYQYEVAVSDTLGGETIQNSGKVTLLKSLRARFP